jgi:hypothetical protein
MGFAFGIKDEQKEYTMLWTDEEIVYCNSMGLQSGADIYMRSWHIAYQRAFKQKVDLVIFVKHNEEFDTVDVVFDRGGRMVAYEANAHLILDQLRVGKFKKSEREILLSVLTDIRKKVKVGGSSNDKI